MDFSPSPSVSSLVVYRGDAFPNFRGDILLGSLKAGTLFRVALDGERMICRETLIDGLVYLLLESTNEAKIVRLVPAD